MTSRKVATFIAISTSAVLSTALLSGCSTDETPTTPMEETTSIVEEGTVEIEPTTPSEQSEIGSMSEELPETPNPEDTDAPIESMETGLAIEDITVTDVDGVPTIELPENLEKSRVLQRTTLQEGTGSTMVSSPLDTVTVRYVGVSVSSGGEIFDTNYNGDPIQFRLDQVIPGWTNGLQGTKEGDRVLLVIPGEYAYGSNVASLPLAVDDTLIFVIDIEKVEPGS